MKSPFPFKLTNSVVYGEEADKNYINNCLRDDVNPLSLSPPEHTGGNMSPLTWNPNGGNANDLASELARHTKALTSNHQATQFLVQSVANLTVAINGM